MLFISGSITLHVLTHAQLYLQRLPLQQAPSPHTLYAQGAKGTPIHIHTGALEQLCGLNRATFMCREVSGWGSRLSCVASGCRGRPRRRKVSAPRISQAASYCSDSPADTLASWNASFSRFSAKKLAAPDKNKSEKPCQQPLEALMFITCENTGILDEMDKTLTDAFGWRL